MWLISTRQLLQSLLASPYEDDEMWGFSRGGTCCARECGSIGTGGKGGKGNEGHGGVFYKEGGYVEDGSMEGRREEGISECMKMCGGKGKG